MTAVAAAATATVVLVIGALFDFYDHRSRLAYMAGVLAATVAYLVGGWVEDTKKRGG